MPVTRQLLRPVSITFILLTFAIALLINLLPWQASVANFAPDFVAMMVVYWTLNQPRRIGIATAFLLGIVMDVGDGNVLGQHALAYTVMAYLTLSRQRLIAVFPFWQQALVALGLLTLGQTLMVLIQLALGNNFVGWAYFVGNVLAAVLWAPLCNLMLSHQRKPVVVNL
ncbi:rod shape-determining protein MreD [Andreprevotia lacus DSM 23236]|jgi:rod shape-determining protein MreD|uniref:Rod shape-determining protein MreD n=1 Tax=Andreprevotia lacus DSM 23236 TaxID=1121001 RepID=A0A1W1X3J0_9NEIS|nr:rod shape-determining protein MreD [Andreprevotia lacus]SMC18475.1 rod shape-determining protein MreD [Andreprevotia lacus DSM 23236]